MVQLSVLIPAWNEADNVKVLVERLRPVAARLDPRHEALFVVPSLDDATVPAAHAAGNRVVVQSEP